MIQVNDKNLYVIGGIDFFPSIFPYDFDMSNATLKIDLCTGTVKEMSKMLDCRYGFAKSSIGHKIYIAGGMSDMCSTSRTSVYDVLKDTWCDLKCMVPG